MASQKRPILSKLRGLSSVIPAKNSGRLVDNGDKDLEALNSAIDLEIKMAELFDAEIARKEKDLKWLIFEKTNLAGIQNEILMVNNLRQKTLKKKVIDAFVWLFKPSKKESDEQIDSKDGEKNKARKETTEIDLKKSYHIKNGKNKSNEEVKITGSWVLHQSCLRI